MSDSRARSKRPSLPTRLLRFLRRRERRFVWFLLAMMVVGAGLEAVGVGLILPFIDLISSPQSLESSGFAQWAAEALGLRSPQTVLALFGGLLLFAIVVKNAYRLLLTHVQFKFVFNKQADLSSAVLDSYLQRPYEFHLERNSTLLFRDVTTSTGEVVGYVMQSMLQVLVEGLVILAISAVLFVVAPVVSAISLAFLGLLTGLILLVARKPSLRMGERRYTTNGIRIKWVTQALGGIKEARILGREDFFGQAYFGAVKEYAKAMRREQVFRAAPRLLVETIIVGGMLLVILLVIGMRDKAAGVVPLLGLYAMAAARLMPSVNRVIDNVTQIRHFQTSLDAVAESLSDSQSQAPPAPEGPHADLELRRSIEIRDVTFSYRNTDKPAVAGISLEIPKGSVVAVVGPTGSGKSTLIDLILGLLAPQEGEICVDGVPINSDLRRWQSKIGYIAQPVYLLDSSIRSNVAFGIPEADIVDERVWTALRRARIESFVCSLPKGLDTEVGERGVRLSGGQRQRLGIARALYVEPEVLVLDEATSALDVRTEQEIVKEVKGFRGKKTIVAITHRLATAHECDLLFFIREGSLRGVGTYDELVLSNPEFAAWQEPATL